MCFSPEASFAGGVIIASIGIFTIKKVHKPSQLVFASIPLFFGIQQIAEGFVWITTPLPEYSYFQKFFTYMFLIMADVLWPLIIPLSILLMEKAKKKIKILKVIFGIGLLLSIYYAYCFWFYVVTPQIMDYHVQYNTDFPKSVAIPAFIVYLFVTITPLFISSIKKMKWLGILMFSSCLLTVVFFTQYLASVWCFFAALISGVIFWILRGSKRMFNLEKLNALKEQIKSLNPL